LKIAINNILQKTSFFAVYFCCRQYGLTNVMQLALKANAFSVIMQLTAITPFKVIQGHQFWY